MHNEDQYILSRLIILEGELERAKERYATAEDRYDTWGHKNNIRIEYGQAQTAYHQAREYCKDELKDRTLHHDINDQDFPHLTRLLTTINRAR